MDESDPDITFDVNDVCNYCRDWSKNAQNLGKIENGTEIWENAVAAKIKLSGKDRKYDCVIGASGGVDSSFLCYIAWKSGLKPLVVHVDGGFDSEIGKENLRKAVEYCGFTLETVTFDLEAYRKIQIAYLMADVVDTDVPADYLIDSTLRVAALKKKVKYVLTGGNFFIDAYMPKAWTQTNKLDYGNLKGIVKNQYPAIYRQVLSHFPKFGSWDEIKSRRFHGLKYVTPLNYVGYNRNDAKEVLRQAWNFRDYGGKHYENIFTRFYQRYILPEKFGVDKRVANYSNLIRSGGMIRAEALELMKEPLYSQEEFESDLAYILSFLQISRGEFKAIMKRKPRLHSEFGSDGWVYKLEALYAKPHYWVGNVLRRIGVLKPT
jgi:N-acetyl sugar amidotransferase